MAKDNLKRIISNMEHVIKFDDFVLGKKHNDFSNSRLILN